MYTKIHPSIFIAPLKKKKKELSLSGSSCYSCDAGFQNQFET